MRLYSASSEEALRARNLLKDWAGEGFISETQYQHLRGETVCELRTTNIFLRLVLFLFTLLIVGAAVGLFFLVFLSRPSEQTSGVCLLIFAAVSYGAAEFAVSQNGLYRYGIEEALAVCSVGFLCVGIEILFSSVLRDSAKPGATAFLLTAAGGALSLWIWHRFGLWYAFPAAMIFVFFLPGCWTSSHPAQHLTVAVFYALGLTIVVATRDRHRLDYLNESYSFAEAALWLGIYLVINLQLPAFHLLGVWWGDHREVTEFSRPYYWATWVLIWCFPALVLTRGIRGKDRFVIAAGAIASILTLICNKPYLGWAQYTWDPMLLGILSTGAALFIRRWLAGGPGGIRQGFTAARVSGSDKSRMAAGTTAAGLLFPESLPAAPHTKSAEFHFGGGDSGGGGASSDF